MFVFLSGAQSCRPVAAVFLAAGSWTHLLHNTFPVVLSQQTKERVKLLIQLADGFCEKGHAHAAEIKKCVTAVDKRYRDFSLRMEKYRTSLEKALGISSDSNKSVKLLCASGINYHLCLRILLVDLINRGALPPLFHRAKVFSWISFRPVSPAQRWNSEMPLMNLMRKSGNLPAGKSKLALKSPPGFTEEVKEMSLGQACLLLCVLWNQTALILIAPNVLHFHSKNDHWAHCPHISWLGHGVLLLSLCPVSWGWQLAPLSFIVSRSWVIILGGRN